MDGLTAQDFANITCEPFPEVHGDSCKSTNLHAAIFMNLYNVLQAKPWPPYDSYTRKDKPREEIAELGKQVMAILKIGGGMPKQELSNLFAQITGVLDKVSSGGVYFTRILEKAVSELGLPKPVIQKQP